MKLTWRDAVTIPFMATIIAVYAAHLAGAEGWLFASTRGTAMMILILGIGGGCALGRATDVFARGRVHAIRLYATLTGILGLAAVAGGILALATGTRTALAVLFGATMALWVLATARHAFTTEPASPVDADARETLAHLHSRPRH
jgi:hypothetical protein